jgi:hypothetical protein
MGLWDVLVSLFQTSTPPQSSRRLDGRSEPLLRASMTMLSHGERGWITMKEAASLFSPMDESYAFGEMDEAGKHNLASFATKTQCHVELMPIQQCVYLTRNASLGGAPSPS